MKKLFLILFILFARAGTYAQTLVNGDFSQIYCTSYGSCTGTYLAKPCVANWFHVAGAPVIFSLGNFVELQSSYTPPTVTFETGGPLGEGPGSQGIAAQYSFLKGGCYKVTIDLGEAQNLCTGSSTTLEVWAAHGLSQSAGVPACISTRPNTSSFEKIGIKTFAPGENYTGPPLTFNYTATQNDDQILIFVNQNSLCTEVATTSPVGHSPPTTAIVKVGLLVDVYKVSISFSPCSFTCTEDVFLVYQSSLIATGGIIEHAGIKVGSSVAAGGSIVSPPAAGTSTLLLGRWIKFESIFNGVVHSGDFFEAIPTNSCDNLCSIDPISMTGTISSCSSATFSNSSPGGVWSSSSSDVPINPSTGVVSPVSGSVLVGIIATITYTVGGCSVSIKEPVSKCTHIGLTRASDTTKTGILGLSQQEIQVYPNPTQNNVTISYPCNGGGQLEIKISDVAGRERYTESVTCNEGNYIQHVVDMSSFSAGVYFIDLTLNDQHVVKKIVKL